MKYLVAFLLLSLSLHATTIHVGKKYAVKSVKKGIELAKIGDTVIVHGGLYREGNIIIDKKIVYLLILNVCLFS